MKEYDVVFMDWNMPVMDGITATKKIRQKFENPEKPWIVAMTAHAMPDHQQTCYDAGMNDFVAKPIESNTIAKALANCPVMKNYSVEDENYDDSFDSTEKDFKEFEILNLEDDDVVDDNFELPDIDILDIDQEIDIDDDEEVEIIDEQKWSELLEMAGSDNKEMVCSIVDNFLENTLQHINNIEKAIKEESIEDLRFATHSIKGSSQSLGVLLLSEKCNKISDFAKQSEWTNALSIKGDLADDYQKIYSLMKDKCQSL